MASTSRPIELTELVELPDGIRERITAAINRNTVACSHADWLGRRFDAAKTPADLAALFPLAAAAIAHARALQAETTALHAELAAVAGPSSSEVH